MKNNGLTYTVSIVEDPPRLKRRKRKPKDFKTGDRFIIRHRAYKPHEVWSVVEVAADRIVVVDVRYLEPRPINSEHWPRLTLLAKALQVYDVEMQ